MGLLDYIEKTRKKPESVKYRRAIVWTFLIMVVIVGVWLSITFIPQNEEKTDFNHSPFSIISDIFKK